MGASYDGLRPSEVVPLTIPDPAEQAPLVARSVTPPSPSGRGGTTLPRQRAPRSCTVFVMTPPNEHTSEGGRDDRGVPYHAEPTLSSAQVLKYASPRFFCERGRKAARWLHPWVLAVVPGHSQRISPKVAPLRCLVSRGPHAPQTRRGLRLPHPSGRLPHPPLRRPVGGRLTCRWCPPAGRCA